MAENKVTKNDVIKALQCCIDKIDLADEIQIAIHKKYLESEVKNDNAE